MPLPVIAGYLGVVATEVIAEIAEQGIYNVYKEYIKPYFDFFDDPNKIEMETPTTPTTISTETLLEVKDLLISMHRYYGIKMPASVTVEEP